MVFANVWLHKHSVRWIWACLEVEIVIVLCEEYIAQATTGNPDEPVHRILRSFDFFFHWKILLLLSRHDV